MAENASPDDRSSSLLIRTKVLTCFRNTKLEDLHAGIVPVTKTRDDSDVTVIDDADPRQPRDTAPKDIHRDRAPQLRRATRQDTGRPDEHDD